MSTVLNGTRYRTGCRSDRASRSGTLGYCPQRGPQEPGRASLEQSSVLPPRLVPTRTLPPHRSKFFALLKPSPCAALRVDSSRLRRIGCPNARPRRPRRRDAHRPRPWPSRRDPPRHPRRHDVRATPLNTCARAFCSRLRHSLAPPTQSATVPMPTPSAFTPALPIPPRRSSARRAYGWQSRASSSSRRGCRPRPRNRSRSRSRRRRRSRRPSRRR